MNNFANNIQIYVQNNKFTNLIFCGFSNLNDNKIVYITKKAFCEIYKMINVIIIMQKLHFKNYTSNNGIQSSLKME